MQLHICMRINYKASVCVVHTDEQASIVQRRRRVLSRGCVLKPGPHRTRHRCPVPFRPAEGASGAPGGGRDGPGRALEPWRTGPEQRRRVRWGPGLRLGSAVCGQDGPAAVRVTTEAGRQDTVGGRLHREKGARERRTGGGGGGGVARGGTAWHELIVGTSDVMMLWCYTSWWWCHATLMLRSLWFNHPGYMSRKIRKFRTAKFDTRDRRKFWLMQFM